jgi:hypothetical protein
MGVATMAMDYSAVSRFIVPLAVIVLVSLASIGFLVLMIRRVGKKSKSADWSRVRVELSYIPKCPKCGLAMKEGFILARGGIQWREQPTPFPLASFWTGLESTSNVGPGVRYNRAWRCESCRVLTVDHNYLLTGK